MARNEFGDRVDLVRLVDATGGSLAFTLEACCGGRFGDQAFLLSP